MISGPIIISLNLPFALDCIININSSMTYHTYKMYEMSSYNANIIYRISVAKPLVKHHLQNVYKCNYKTKSLIMP